MKQINIHEAKTHLSRLVDEAMAGEEIVIAKTGRPMVKLTPIQSPHPVKLGGLKGKIHIPDDFDAPLPDELLDAFEGGRS